MLKFIVILIIIIGYVFGSPTVIRKEQLTEEEIKLQLSQYNEDAIKLCNKVALARWNLQTDNKNTEYAAEVEKQSKEYAEFEKNEWMKYWNDADENMYIDPLIKRQVQKLKKLGSAALDEDDYAQLQSTIMKMSTIYNTAKICPYNKQMCTEDEEIKLDPQIEDILSSSTNYDELLYTWKAWRDKSGKLMRTDYEKYVKVMNKAAETNFYKSATDWWQSVYEDADFVKLVDNLWKDIKPLYDELHTYVRYQLFSIYGSKMDKSNKNIPAHLLGNMWAQSWSYLYNKTRPFKDVQLIDITSKLKELEYSATDMFDLSNEFYIKMGLKDNKMSYDPERALIVDPNDGRVITCHASAWDFCDGADFRIKMCTNINMKDFITIHHEMGHIQYFQQYADLPLAVRGGANPGFHEAIGDTIALSVATPQHLKEIKLLDDYEDSYENDINALYSMALERLAFLPFGLLIDKWRWEVFDGLSQTEWNTRWWELREQYQKISAPVERSEDDFDPGAKYHVAANSQYISYFIAHILEFQMYKALCIEADQYDPNSDKPLHKCDFYRSEKAGKKLSDGLELGAKVHWSEVLEKITGTKELSSDAIIEYFQPLYKFLQTKNKEQEIREVLEEYNTIASKECNALVTAEWNFQTNINDQHMEQAYLEATEQNAKFIKDQYNKHFKDLKPNDFEDENIKRQLTFLTKLGTDILEDNDVKSLGIIINNMQKIYNNAEVCPYQHQDCDLATEGLTLDPDINAVLANSQNYEEQQYIWQQWHEKTGKLMRNDYKKYVELMNKAAIANGYKDAGEMWRADYEDLNLADNMKELWSKIEPLYDHLHTYVRYKLAELYDSKKYDANEPLIPAHLLGNMWAQSWVNLYERIKPFPNASDIDVTAKMIELGYTPLKMFQESDRFYMDLGLESNAMSYGSNAIIEKPDDRVIVCHASAWDFCNGKDYRIKQCTTVDMNDFVTVHHEMGHIQYYILYQNEPIPFRSGANPGFHEAVGDLIALSVSSPKHLKKIGLIDKFDDTVEDNINALMKMALDRLAFLPFGLLIDTYRWDIFGKKIEENKWNSHWEELREKFQKIKSPVERDENDFDAGAKYHVGANSQYMNYFFAHILEFQLHKAMCITAGQYDPNNEKSEPLHKCDIDGSLAAGRKLRDGLSLGMSKHWSTALEAMTGERTLKADAILEYFMPLQKFLQEANIRLKEEHAVRMTLATYSAEASNECNALVTAEWNFQTNINDKDIEQAYLNAVLQNANFIKEQHDKHFKDLSPDNYVDPKVKRQVKFLSKLGTDILDTDRLNELTNSVNNMVSIYNNARVCPYKKQDCDEAKEGLDLNEGITNVMATSTDYDELKYIWQKWHDNSGKLMRENYKIYVESMNEAAVLNNYPNAGVMWQSDYEDEQFVTNMKNLWIQIEPLYNQLHKYVRRKLLKFYQNDMNTDDKLIPAHLLGNMWAQSWVNLYERIKPFPNASDIDVTPKMIEQGYTPLKMFEISDEFYKNLGLEPNYMSYHPPSIIVEPTDRQIVCHASAWDFCDGNDFRIKQCTLVNMVDFETAHHEMGHIQYYILYKNQPETFRHGANPGFHEAVGDLIALSVTTPTHLDKIGLLKDFKNTEEDNINALFKTALKKVAFLPFGLLIDLYRWDIFSGDVKPENWNSHWEKLRENYQKVRSPVERNEGDFDAGAKYHVGANSQYMNYFFAHVLEFQLHKAMCIAAGQYNPNDEKSKPLHQCDIDGSKEAGKKLRDGLSLGLSTHWSNSLEIMTGDRKLKADAIMEYFLPLLKYLIKDNQIDPNPEPEPEPEPEPQPEPEQQPEEDNLVPIIVGSIIGGLVLIAIIGYAIYYFMKRR